MTNAPTPWFVYGSLKPKQLGFRRIAQFISHSEPVELSGHELVLRDGLPGIRVSDQGRLVRGFLLWPKPGVDEALRRAIAAFESPKIYEVKDVAVNEEGSAVLAHANVLKHSDKSSPEIIRNGRWAVQQDLSFRHALPVLWRFAHDPQREAYDSESREFWQIYLPMMGTFLNLWSVFERYVAFAQPALTESEQSLNDPTDAEPRRMNISDHFNALNKSELGVYVRNQITSSLPTEGRRRVDSVKKPSRSQTNPWDYWYVVRNNAAHRGKTAFQDMDIVREAAIGLSEALIELLAKEVPPLRQIYVDEGCV